MNRIAAWIIAWLDRTYRDDTPAEPEPEPEPVIQHVTYEFVYAGCDVAATRPRAAVCVGLVCEDLELVKECTDGSEVEIEDPLRQWRYVYGDTAFASLN